MTRMLSLLIQQRQLTLMVTVWEITLILGAVIGELIAGKEHREALKVGTVTFVASILMILIKLAVSGIMTYYFVERSVEYIF